VPGCGSRSERNDDFKSGVSRNRALIEHAIASAEELEFLFTPGRAVSLSNTSAELPIGTNFDQSSIEAALPGYDVRFVSVEEQERSGKTMGPKGTAESAFSVSRNGRELLRVFGYGQPEELLTENPTLVPTQVVRIEAVAGVIDASGSTLGAPLNKAFRQGKVVCDAHEAGVCWSTQLPGIMYVPGHPKGCDLSFLYSGSTTEFSADLIPDCVNITGLALGG
jgi:hypothetical protein